MAALVQSFTNTKKMASPSSSSPRSARSLLKLLGLGALAATFTLALQLKKASVSSSAQPAAQLRIDNPMTGAVLREFSEFPPYETVGELIDKTLLPDFMALTACCLMCLVSRSKLEGLAGSSAIKDEVFS